MKQSAQCIYKKKIIINRKKYFKSVVSYQIKIKLKEFKNDRLKFIAEDVFST